MMSSTLTNGSVTGTGAGRAMPVEHALQQQVLTEVLGEPGARSTVDTRAETRAGLGDVLHRPFGRLGLRLATNGQHDEPADTGGSRLVSEDRQGRRRRREGDVVGS